MPSKDYPDPTHASQIHERVNAQFGAAAAAYSASLVHADPAALAHVVELAAPKSTDVALDIATGTGNTALALAPRVAQVIAYDMTPAMLAETARHAAARGLTNIVTRQGIAESLSFPDAAFDIVTVRQAPHHFADVRVAIREMARVARPGARLVIVDSTSPEDDSLDRQWNYIEKLRDPSHVRNYRPSEWRSMTAAAALRITFEEVGFATENGRGMDFASWVRRMNTPPDAVAELTRLLRNASPALAHALRLEFEGDAIRFCVPSITLALVKAQRLWQYGEIRKSFVRRVLRPGASLFVVIPSEERPFVGRDGKGSAVWCAQNGRAGIHPRRKKLANSAYICATPPAGCGRVRIVALTSP